MLRTTLAAWPSMKPEPGGRLDLLALATLWLVVVPPGDFGHGATHIVIAFRVALSAVFGVDIAIRSALAPRHLRYALTHPVALASVAFPPVRVIFSIQLVRSVFQRGQLGWFLLAATVLVLDGAVIVYLLERHAPQSNIHTLGNALWWSFVTVTTWGRITACFIMATGLLTLAVVTAQVASSFVAQGPGQATPAPQDEAASREMMSAELDQRLARIERLLTASQGNSATD